MGTTLIILGLITLVAAVLTALETWFGWVRSMIRWLFINPKEKPHLSSPRIIEHTFNAATVKEIGIEIQNMPYEGWFPWLIHRRAENSASIDYEVIDPFGEVVMEGEGRWESPGGRVCGDHKGLIGDSLSRAGVTLAPPPGPTEPETKKAASS